MKPRYSIVIPTHKHLTDALIPCLQSIQKYTDLSDCEVLVIANGCGNDFTREFVQTLGAPFKLIWIDEQSGYTKSVNAGIRAAQGEYILLLNNDCQILDSPRNEWLETLVAPMADPQIGMVGIHELWSAEINSNFIVFYCALIRRSVFENIGLPNEIFSPGFGEDIDFCARLMRAGYRYANVDPTANQAGELCIGTFPLYHAGGKTFHDSAHDAGYKAIVERNLKILHNRYQPVKMLAVLVNFGVEGLNHLYQTIDSLKSFDSRYTVDIVVHSNVSVGRDDIREIVHTEAPWGDWLNLPWKCRETLHQERENYDLYLYAEHDHLFTQRNIDAFLEITPFLSDAQIAGFIEWENAPHGERFYPAWHADYGWGESFTNDAGTFAKFTNLHQGSFLATRRQLARAIAVGKEAFLDPQRRLFSSPYGIRERCNTDFYDTGFKKVIPVSRFEDFLIHHLSDHYYGVYGTKCDSEMNKALAELTERPEVSIIIPTYNHCDDLLRPCLESLRVNTDLAKTEILVVSNGCTDGTDAYVKSLGHPFKLISHRAQLGFTKATNIGLRAARGKYLVLLNNDTIIQGSDWIDLMKAPFLARHGVGASGPMKFIGKPDKSNDFIMMFCMMTTRAVVDDIGALDEQFAPGGVEDVDYGLRLLLAGYELVQVPENHAVAFEPDLSTGAFPIFHSGNATYRDEQGWHANLIRNNGRLKAKFPEYFKGLTWIEEMAVAEPQPLDFATLHEHMKEADSWLHWEMFEVDVNQAKREELAGKTVIDIGANKGFFAIHALELGAKEVYCFEPVHEIYEQQLELVGDIPQVHSFNLAVLDGSVSEVHMHEAGVVSNIWGDPTTSPTPCVSLVTALSRVPDHSNMVLKIDCEGSEFEILFHTPANVIRQFSTIYVEMHDEMNPNFQHKTPELLSYLRSLGFTSEQGPQAATWLSDGSSEDSPVRIYKLRRHEQPRVTVIIPTYQRYGLLREALNSVREQTYRNICALVVADGPDVEVEQIVAEYQAQSSDITYAYADVPHEGFISARSKMHGIDLLPLHGYVCFLDDDNVLLPQYVEKMVGVIVPDEKEVAIGQVQLQRVIDGEYMIKTAPPDANSLGFSDIDALNILVKNDIARLCRDEWHQDRDKAIDHDFRFIQKCLTHTGYGFVPEVVAFHRDMTRETAKVFDCFPFFNELDLLEMRLSELDSVVDYFVIVEANLTHSGQPKPLYLAENMDRFKKWEKKIVIQVVDLSTIEFANFDFDPCWVREHLQRDSGRDVVNRMAKKGDFCIVSDVDEIPRASAIQEYIVSGQYEVGVLALERFMYALNYRNVTTDEPQLNAKIIPTDKLHDHNLNDVRFADKESIFPTRRIENGGWHFTFQNGLDQVIEKVKAFAHQEYAAPEKIDHERMEQLFREGKDVYSANTTWETVEIDETFPQYVRDHEDELRAKGWIKPRETGTVIKLEDWKQSRLTVTAEISTKDRYQTTLPLTISAIINQTHKPEKLKIYDDGEQANLFELAPFSGLLQMAIDKGIEVEVLTTPRKGQVTNHQHCLEVATTDVIWRCDDDNIPEPDCLHNLLAEMKEGVGAVGGLVHHPGGISPLPKGVDGSLNDLAMGLNIAWFDWNSGPKECEHLYSTFAYRVSSTREVGGYPLDLSPCGHREESWLTHKIHRAGYKVICTPYARTAHLREATGGIRTYTDPAMWEHDEGLFQAYLRAIGKVSPKSKMMILDMGLGDHLVAKAVLSEIRKRNNNQHLVMAVCFPSVFEEEPNVTLISIADAKAIVGHGYQQHSLYAWMWDNNWDAPLADAMVKFWGGQ